MNVFRRILVPHDFSEAATDALRVAIQLAKRHRGRLTVLHVVPPYQPMTYVPEVSVWIPDADIVKGTRRSLADLVQRELRGRGGLARASTSSSATPPPGSSRRRKAQTASSCPRRDAPAWRTCSSGAWPRRSCATRRCPC